MALAYFMSNSASSFSAGRSGPSQESTVITAPPPSSRVRPFSRTVTVEMTCLASWPAIARVWPVSFTSKSTSYSLAGFSWGCCGSSRPSALAASRCAFSCASRSRLLQLVERRHLVGLLLHVEVVDFLFFQVDDAAGHLVELDLAIALDGVGGFDAFFRGFSTKHPGHSSQHAFELELRLIARLDIGGQRHRRGGDQAPRPARNLDTRFMR